MYFNTIFPLILLVIILVTVACTSPKGYNNPPPFPADIPRFEANNEALQELNGEQVVLIGNVIEQLFQSKRPGPPQKWEMKNTEYWLQMKSGAHVKIGIHFPKDTLATFLNQQVELLGQLKVGDIDNYETDGTLVQSRYGVRIDVEGVRRVKDSSGSLPK